MALPYLELYYASTQQSILTGADGFGVRAYTEGLPKEIIERLKSRNLFVYNGGSKPIAGTFDLLQNPEMVLEYPKTYTFFKEEVDGQVFYVFTRTAFLGRDYGWYLPVKEESARSGNLFCHAILFREENFLWAKPDQVFQALASKLFRPQNLVNQSDNEELRRLLTGAPPPLPNGFCTLCEQSTPLQLFPHLEETILAIYTALETQRRVVIVQRIEQTEQHLVALLACLPRFVIKSIGFATNFQEFNLYTDNTILFINELYQRDIPKDHPYLLICDYRLVKFPELANSDFLEHISKFIQSGNLFELQRMNEDFDRMVADFTDGMSFNQLFYAWLHLLAKDSGTYQFQPAEVVHEIKDYALTQDFRNRMEDYILDSFKDALANVQHARVANSLKLLADIKPESRRWEVAQKNFSNYFFKDDNAAGLFLNSTDKELVFSALLLDDQEFRIYDFIARSTISLDLMAFFLRKFCEISFETAESTVFSAAINEKINSSFGSYLERVWGKENYRKFLQDHDFFIGMGEPFQPQFFGTDTKRYLQETAKGGGNALGIVKAKTEKAEFFHQYLDALIEQATDPTSSTSYQDKIALFEYYPGLVAEGFRRFSPAQNIDRLLEMILRDFDEKCQKDKGCIDQLSAAARRLGAVAASEKKLWESKKSNDQYVRQMDYYEDTSKFIGYVLNYKYKIDDFTSILLPQPYRKEGYENAIRFMLSVLPFETWQEPRSALKLCQYFFKQEKLKKEKFKSYDEEFDLPEFIPAFYEEQIDVLQTEILDFENKIINFYKFYILTIWKLRIQKKGDATDPSKLDSFKAKKYSISILNRVKEINMNLCKIIIEQINKELASDGGDDNANFAEYIQNNVHTGNIITGFLKRFSPFKKD